MNHRDFGLVGSRFHIFFKNGENKIINWVGRSQACDGLLNLWTPIGSYWFDLSAIQYFVTVSPDEWASYWEIFRPDEVLAGAEASLKLDKEWYVKREDKPEETQ